MLLVCSSRLPSIRKSCRKPEPSQFHSPENKPSVSQIKTREGRYNTLDTCRSPPPFCTFSVILALNRRRNKRHLIDILHHIESQTSLETLETYRDMHRKGTKFSYGFFWQLDVFLIQLNFLKHEKRLSQTAQKTSQTKRGVQLSYSLCRPLQENKLIHKSDSEILRMQQNRYVLRKGELYSRQI